MESWVKSSYTKSVNNFWNRGTNWGNYLCTLTFVNLLNEQITIHWINRSGQVRSQGFVLPPYEQTTILSELNHPHVVCNRMFVCFVGW